MVGFFILNKKIFEYLSESSDNIMWEDDPLVELTKNQQLMAFKHHGFWQCMDAMRDKVQLDHMWENNPKWKIW